MTQGKDPQTEKKPEVSQTTEDKPEEKKMSRGQKIGLIIFAIFVIAIVVMFIKKG
jgi:pheromone shutdown protein TraB